MTAVSPYARSYWNGVILECTRARSVIFTRNFWDNVLFFSVLLWCVVSLHVCGVDQ